MIENHLPDLLDMHHLPDFEEQTNTGSPLPRTRSLYGLYAKNTGRRWRQDVDRLTIMTVTAYIGRTPSKHVPPPPVPKPIFFHFHLYPLLRSPVFSDRFTKLLRPLSNLPSIISSPW